MGLVNNALRLVPGLGEEQASANAYFGFTAFGGVLGWGVVVALVATSSGSALDAAWTTPAIIAMGLWLVVVLLRLSVGYFSTEDGVQLSTPNMIWVAVLLLAYVVTAVGLTMGNPLLVWAPWYGAFAVGYLATGYLVDSGAIYLGAGVLSVVGLVAGVVGVVPGVAVWGLLGALHVLPLAADAATTDRSPDAVEAGSEESEDVGGVVT